ncbi:hypothetical protein [Noviherbaspirillum agri]
MAGSDHIYDPFDKYLSSHFLLVLAQPLDGACDGPCGRAILPILPVDLIESLQVSRYFLLHPLLLGSQSRRLAYHLAR